MAELSRRDFIKLSAYLLAVTASAPFSLCAALAFGQWVNDEHSGLNLTRVSRISRPSSQAQLLQLVKAAIRSKKSFSICGARHSAGGQQFLEDQMLVDCTALNRVIACDRVEGTITVEPGARWSDLLHWLHGDYINGAGIPGDWTIRQRPTGTDHLTVGGTLSSNAHGQGLNFKPLIDDIISLQVIDSRGQLLTVSRTKNAEFFPLAIGGYGLFAVIATITFKLIPTKKYRCQAEPIVVSEINSWRNKALAEGYTYGSVQINIDEKSSDFLLSGVANKYLAVSDDTKCGVRRGVTPRDWTALVAVAHQNKAEAWKRFTALQLSSNNLVDWGYRWHSSPYVAGYHGIIDKQENRANVSSEVLTELYVPMASLNDFMKNVASDCLANNTNVLYSTVRFIDKDSESFLAWAKEPFACVIFNLHVEHTAHQIAVGALALRRLINRASQYGGSYYLTYHRFASKDEILACYPQFPQLLKEKKRLDPDEVFVSDWYRHYKAMFA